MATEKEWSDDELQAAVAAYLEMLRLERQQTPYSKADFRRQLRSGSLSNRTEGSVEYRMQNISAVMESLGHPRIAGYKPAANVGQANEARLRRLIENAGGVPSVKSTSITRLQDILSGPDVLMGVKAVFGMISSHVLCFAEGAARRAVTQPFVIAIGGGKEVREGMAGRVVNVARTAPVYGPTSVLVTDPNEVRRLAQWPVAIALHDVWRFIGAPHLVEDLGFPDRTILAGAQDGIVRPGGAIERLWDALKEWPIEPEVLPLPGNFFDSGKPVRVDAKLPSIPLSAAAEEGERVWKLQLRTERDPKVSKEAKRLCMVRHGAMICQACDFTHSDSAMFDAHHPTPLAVGKRTTLPEHLQILCPTCHRRAHRKARLDPYTLPELRIWVDSGRP